LGGNADVGTPGAAGRRDQTGGSSRDVETRDTISNTFDISIRGCGEKRMDGRAVGVWCVDKEEERRAPCCLMEGQSTLKYI
jgi:hypothetical protein